MKPRTLLVLLALVVGLGAFVWFYEREQPGSEEREKLAKRVLGVEREDVARLELHAGDRVTELVRTHQANDQAAADESPKDAGAPPAKSGDDQDRWRLRRPIDFAADYWQVDALVRTLAELDSARKLDEYDPKEVGLDSPRGRIVVELTDGKKKELLIGSEVPGSGNLIVAVEGEPGASVVAGSLWESVEKEAAAWRDQDLFAPEREDVVAMTLEHGAPDVPSAVRLTRAGEDFELAAPIHDRADADGVNALIRELTGLRATAFLDSPPPLASIGLDPPRARLTVELASGEPFVLLWGARKEGSQESYAKTGDLVVTTAAALDQQLERAVPDWRSKDWSSMPVFEVDRVTVTDAQGTLELTRGEGSWKRGEEAIEYGPVSDFLYAIDDAKAERIADPAEAVAIGQPEITVTFTAVDEVVGQAQPTPNGESPAATAKTERLELYVPTAENLVPVRTDGREAVL
ncbi:MAG TPA: DUF4340 domain-containing protein, partial [Thermoanaerobaculia bacterium]|nr:DUF4340 domain-containing protein [Thermoanaerobaculia bacterium]